MCSPLQKKCTCCKCFIYKVYTLKHDMFLACFKAPYHDWLVWFKIKIIIHCMKDLPMWGECFGIVLNSWNDIKPSVWWLVPWAVRLFWQNSSEAQSAWLAFTATVFTGLSVHVFPINLYETLLTGHLTNWNLVLNKREQKFMLENCKM